RQRVVAATVGKARRADEIIMSRAVADAELRRAVGDEEIGAMRAALARWRTTGRCVFDPDGDLRSAFLEHAFVGRGVACELVRSVIGKWLKWILNHATRRIRVQSGSARDQDGGGTDGCQPSPEVHSRFIAWVSQRSVTTPRHVEITRTFGPVQVVADMCVTCPEGNPPSVPVTRSVAGSTLKIPAPSVETQSWPSDARAMSVTGAEKLTPETRVATGCDGSHTARPRLLLANQARPSGVTAMPMMSSRRVRSHG